MLKDFVCEGSNAPGTATTINLTGALADRLSFAAVFTNGSPVYYYMDDGVQAEWGVGTFNTGSPNTLTRSTVLGNTANTTARLNFTGTVRVYNELPAARVPYVDTSNTLVLPANCRVGTLAGGMPIGLIAIWPMAAAPAGWLFCGGQAVSRTTYSALFSFMSTGYGAGDGSTTFNVPDLRGRVPVGRDNMGGTAASRMTVISGSTLSAAGGSEGLQLHGHTITIGDAGHVHTVADPAHTHSINDPTHVHAFASVQAPASGAFGTSSGTVAIQQIAANTAAAATGIGINAAGTGISVNPVVTGITATALNTGTGTAQNVQPSIILNYILYAGV